MEKCQKTPARLPWSAPSSPVHLFAQLHFHSFVVVFFPVITFIAQRNHIQSHARNPYYTYICNYICNLYIYIYVYV